MRIQPRRQILEIWESVVRASFQDGVWIWGGRDEPNSICDAEQLLCLLYPATELPNLGLERPDEMAGDVATALRALGDPAAIPERLLEVLADYLDRYTDEAGEPVFAAGSYLSTVSDDDGPDAAGPRRMTEEQLALEVVDSFSVSVTLCLAALGFITLYRPPTLALSEKLQRGFRDRLTCAMIGLLRSFVVNVMSPADPGYGAMMRLLNQEDAPDELVHERLRTRLRRVRTRLREDVRIGVNVEEPGLSDENLFFECGWAWGIARNSTPVLIDVDGTHLPAQPPIAAVRGIADPRPFLYSTLAALYGIDELRSARVRELGLLTDEQRRLNEALQLRWDLTQRFWSTVARFGERKWPLEDIPWRTADGEESDYLSLLVSALLVQDFANHEVTDSDLNRLVEIFEYLAQRGRITRRVTYHDDAVAMHVPGLRIRLDGTSALGPELFRCAADFAPLLLKCTVQSARLSATIGVKDQLIRLAEASMDHLWRRRIDYGTAAGLWDDPGELLFPNENRKPLERPWWYLTVRVVEALVSAAKTLAEPPLRSAQLASRVLDLLHEADHLFAQEMLNVDAAPGSALRAELARIETTLSMARRAVHNRPGTATALAMDGLRMLDELVSGRQEQPRGDVVSVSIHLESDASSDAVEQAVLDVLHAFGLVLEDAGAPVAGSWFRAMKARFRDKADSADVLLRLERALELQALHRPQAEIDSAQADAVAKLITALGRDPNAFVQIGSVFLIKVDGVVVVRNLSQRELAHLQRNSRILASPQRILQALEEFAAGEEIVIERPPVRVGVGRPDGDGKVSVRLDNGRGSVSNYDVSFGEKNGARPGSVLLAGTVHVQVGPDGTALLHEDQPTLVVKRPANFPRELEMVLDCGDGARTYLLEFGAMS